MKSKRRHELKTNDLAQWLDDASVSFKDWGVYLVGGAAVIIIAAVIVSYIQTAKADQIGRDYSELRTAMNVAPSGIRKTGDEFQHSLEKMAELANRSTDDAFKVDAIIRRGEFALQLAENGEQGIDATYLSQAKSAFEQVVSNYEQKSSGGGGRAGRRVQLPGGESVDYTKLTTDGQTLLRLSLEWAASNCGSSTYLPTSPNSNLPY